MQRYFFTTFFWNEQKIKESFGLKVKYLRNVSWSDPPLNMISLLMVRLYHWQESSGRKSNGGKMIMESNVPNFQNFQAFLPEITFFFFCLHSPVVRKSVYTLCIKTFSVKVNTSRLHLFGSVLTLLHKDGETCAPVREVRSMLGPFFVLPSSAVPTSVDIVCATLNREAKLLLVQSGPGQELRKRQNCFGSMICNDIE